MCSATSTLWDMAENRAEDLHGLVGKVVYYTTGTTVDMFRYIIDQTEGLDTPKWQHVGRGSRKDQFTAGDGRLGNHRVYGGCQKE